MKEELGRAVQAETRRLAAIMFTDIVGFSRQMGNNEAHTLRLLEVHNRLIRQAVNEHHGTVIKTVGDAFLVDFPSVVHAVQCAQQIQAQFRARNTDKEPTEQIHIRIGIHLGDIVQRDGDVFGDGVNIAARLQEIAEPDAICVSDMVYRDVTKKLDLGAVVALGRPKLKNIAEQFEAYALLPEPPKGVRQALRVQRLKLSRRVRPVHWLSVVGLLLIAGTLLTVHYLPFLLFPPQILAPNTEAVLPPLPLPGKPSIIVLPFVNLSNDPEQEYFSDGMTEDLITDLSKISGLFVIARTSAFFYKGKVVKVGDVSKELGVRYVLEGSVRRADKQVRITAQLIDAILGHQLWAERYDRPLTDIFALQDEIRQEIIAALEVKLTGGDQERLVRRYADNLEAHDYYWRGREYYLRNTKEAYAQARQMYERALELDPKYAEAYVGLGRVYWMEWVYLWSQDPQSLERAFELAQKAVALDDSLPEAHQLLGWSYLWKNRQHEQAIAEGEKAIALNSNNADSYYALAHILNFAGRPEEAIVLEEKSLLFNPYCPFGNLLELGRAYHLTGRYEEAVAILKRALIRRPNAWLTHSELAIIYSELGREEEARAEAAEVLRINPNFSLEAFRQAVPIKDPAVLERNLAALRKAGLK